MRHTSQNRRMSCRTILFKYGGEKKIAKVTEFRRLAYTTYIFVTFVTVQWKLPRVCVGGKLSLFSDISQNWISEKRTLHRIQYIGIKNFSIFWEFHSLMPFKSRLFPIFFCEKQNITQENLAFKKYKARKKFIFWQIIENFTKNRRNTWIHDLCNKR